MSLFINDNLLLLFEKIVPVIQVAALAILAMQMESARARMVSVDQNVTNAHQTFTVFQTAKVCDLTMMFQKCFESTFLVQYHSIILSFLDEQHL